nr:sigma-70 family RNA polymerase sigma factor [Arthrobacter wenxiniae]
MSVKPRGPVPRGPAPRGPLPGGRNQAAGNGNAGTAPQVRGQNPGNALQESAARTELLVLQFIGLADSLSRRYRATGCDPEDLQQVARLGLVKAAGRYSETGGSGFMAFAVPTITGELKRYLRDQSWAVRPPRPIQEARLRIRQVRPELTQRLGREPSSAELSSATGMSVRETTQALIAERDMVAQQILTDDPPSRDDGLGRGIIPALDDPGYERIDQKLTVEAVLRGASEEDRRLLHLRFVEELSQGQMALEFGVSQMQISRQLKQLLNRLRRRLAEAA